MSKPSQTNARPDGAITERKETPLPILEPNAKPKVNSHSDDVASRPTGAEPEEQVRLVAAGMPTGWAAMAKTIRDVDEDKVKDYKDDIDTLLVFTGLFSAVLSAFVLVSIQMLSPDKQDTIIQYLAQISTQNYTVTSGAINSTTSPLSQSPPPFNLSLVALRVNYLWFSSLILTLVTASFAMLVKQWLREFLAYEYTSPHERLRARQFRYQALTTWKVYVIAGILPLLLQLALGLFFLGLCFFTQSDVHGIGTMCIVLVALWLGFFIAATVAPVFSPRCPYKTTLLKSVMIILRCSFRYIKSRSTPPPIPDPGPPVLDIFPQSRFGFNMFALISNSIRRINEHVKTILSDRLKRIRKHFETRSDILMAGEESEAVKKDADEVSLLTEVDGLLLDDDLLGTTILDALTQSHVEPSAIIDFVVKAITYRLKGTKLERPLKSRPDLERLTNRGRISISDIVAATVSSTKTMTESWVQDAILLLLASAEKLSSSKARSAILRYVEKAPLSMVQHTLAECPREIRSDGNFRVSVRNCLAVFVEAQLKVAVVLQEFVKAGPDRSLNVVKFQNTLFSPNMDPKDLHLPDFIPTQWSPVTFQDIIRTHMDIPVLDDIVRHHPDMFTSDMSADIVNLMSMLLIKDQSSTSLSLLDLEQRSKSVCEFSSNMFGALIQHLLVPGRSSSKEIGPWLENAIRILLSLPASSLTSTGRKGLIHLCLVNGPNRLYPLIRKIVSDPQKLTHNLSRLHELCTEATDSTPDTSLEGLFEKAVSIVLSIHSRSTIDSLLARRDPGWMEHVLLILDRRNQAKQERQRHRDAGSGLNVELRGSHAPYKISYLDRGSAGSGISLG